MKKYITIGIFLMIVLSVLVSVPLKIPNNPFWGYWKSDHIGERYCDGKRTDISFGNTTFYYNEATSSACAIFAMNPISARYSVSSIGTNQYQIYFTDPDGRGDQNFSVNFVSDNTFLLSGYAFTRVSLFDWYFPIFDIMRADRES